MNQLSNRWTQAVGFLLLAGCGTEDAGLSRPGTSCPVGSSVSCGCPDGSLGNARCNADGKSAGLCACGASTGTGGATGTGGSKPNPTSGGSSTGGNPGVSTGGVGNATSQAGSTSSGSQAGAVGLPCDVKAVVDANCATCHGSTPAFGAPMSLASAADFRATGGSIGQRVLARIRDDQRPMPPPPNARLSAAQQATLERWISAGAPAASCTTDPGTIDPGTTETDPLPADVTCYRVTARASAAGAKYTVPTTPDMYRCFEYAPPWGNKTVQVVAARPIIDNMRVIHHWILYNGSAAANDGANGACSGAHPNASFITGWAPGGEPMRLPDDVGLRTESGGFSLEIHYNNTAGEGQQDASGVDLCVTEKARPKVAAVHWLGTQTLSKINATGTCVPINTEPVTILSSSPHMHLQGRHMKTVINRKGGAAETLIDQPFDFNTQISYKTPAVINVGDTLTTTCTYATATPFGQKTNQEMCYNFVMAYPAGQLAQSIQLLRKNDCTGL